MLAELVLPLLERRDPELVEPLASDELVVPELVERLLEELELVEPELVEPERVELELVVPELVERRELLDGLRSTAGSFWGGAAVSAGSSGASAVGMRAGSALPLERAVPVSWTWSCCFSWRRS